MASRESILNSVLEIARSGLDASAMLRMVEAVLPCESPAMHVLIVDTMRTFPPTLDEAAREANAVVAVRASIVCGYCLRVASPSHDPQMLARAGLLCGLYGVAMAKHSTRMPWCIAEIAQCAGFVTRSHYSLMLAPLFTSYLYTLDCDPFGRFAVTCVAAALARHVESEAVDDALAALGALRHTIARRRQPLEISVDTIINPCGLVSALLEEFARPGTTAQDFDTLRSSLLSQDLS